MREVLTAFMLLAAVVAAIAIVFYGLWLAWPPLAFVAGGLYLLVLLRDVVNKRVKS